MTRLVFSFLQKPLFPFLFLCALFSFQFVPAKSFEMMVYNCENLFNGEHEEGVNDFAYLPLSFPGKEDGCRRSVPVPAPVLSSSATGNGLPTNGEAILRAKYFLNECLTTDWNHDKFMKKIQQINRVIHQERDHSPSFMGVVEVSLGAFEDLKNELGYKDGFISDRPDFRGVRLGLLFNHRDNPDDAKTFSCNRKESHQVVSPLFADHPTRDILEVRCVVHAKDGDYPLSIFLNHWPSQNNDPRTREFVAKTLKSIIQKREKEHIDGNATRVIIMGDFNTIENDSNNYLEQYFSHMVYLKDYSDPGEEAQGTHFFQKEWNFLDRVYFSSTLQDNPDNSLKIQSGSFHVYNPEFLTKNRYFLKAKGDSFLRRLYKNKEEYQGETEWEKCPVVKLSDDHQSLKQSHKSKGEKFSKKRGKGKTGSAKTGGASYLSSSSADQYVSDDDLIANEGWFRVESKATQRSCSTSTTKNVVVVKVPFRYNFSADNDAGTDALGFSDHFPIYFNLDVKVKGNNKR